MGYSGDYHKSAFQYEKYRKVKRQNYGRVKAAYEKGISKIHEDYPSGLTKEELEIEKALLRDRIRKEKLTRWGLFTFIVLFAIAYTLALYWLG